MRTMKDKRWNMLIKAVLLSQLCCLLPVTVSAKAPDAAGGIISGNEAAVSENGVAQTTVSGNPIEVHITKFVDRNEGAGESPAPEKSAPAPAERVPVPSSTVQITRGIMAGPVSADEPLTMFIGIKNLGTAVMKTPAVSVSPSDALVLLDVSATFLPGDIKPGEQGLILLQLMGAPKITVASAEIGVEVKYYYQDGNETKQATESGKVYVPTVPTKEEVKIDGATPNVIISEYTYGGKAVATGDSFSLQAAFLNTSGEKQIENVVLSLEPGEGGTLTSSSNTFYYPAIAPGGKADAQADMQILPAAKNSAVVVTLHFKYEYVDNDKRSQVTSSQTISIPVYQKDRFEITPMNVPDSVPAGQEQAIALSYVNKGKGEVANVRAEITGDVPSPGKVQNLGNFEAGKNGTISMVVIPEEEGQLDFMLRVTYEDANMEEKVKEFPIRMRVTEPEQEMPEEEEAVEEPETGSGKKNIMLAAGAGIAVLALLAYRSRRRKSRLARQQTENLWEDADGKE